MRAKDPRSWSRKRSLFQRAQPALATLLNRNRNLNLSHLQFFTGAKGAQLTRLFDCLEVTQVWIKDRRGRYVWVNHAFLLNYAVNEKAPNANLSQVRGKTDYD